MSQNFESEPPVWQWTQTLDWAAGEVKALSLSPDGRFLVAGGGQIGIWEMRCGRFEPSLALSKLPGTASATAFAPDGQGVAVGCDRQILLVDLRERKARVLSLESGISVCSIAVSPDGRQLAAGCSDGAIERWDLAAEQPLPPLVAHRFPVWSVAFSPDGALLAGGSGDGTVGLWEVETDANRATLLGHTSSVLSVAFRPDGLILASGGSDRSLRLWWLELGRELATLEGASVSVEAIAFAPDGQTLVAGCGDGSIRIWPVGAELQVGEPVAPIGTLESHPTGINSVAIAPTCLVSGDRAGTIRVWHRGSDH